MLFIRITAPETPMVHVLAERRSTGGQSIASVTGNGNTEGNSARNDIPHSLLETFGIRLGDA